jgi:hypothetical protein
MVQKLVKVSEKRRLVRKNELKYIEFLKEFIEYYRTYRRDPICYANEEFIKASPSRDRITIHWDRLNRWISFMRIKMLRLRKVDMSCSSNTAHWVDSSGLRLNKVDKLPILNDYVDYLEKRLKRRK